MRVPWIQAAVLCFGLSTGALSANSFAQQPTGNLKSDLSLAKSTFRAGEPVDVRFTVTNVTGQPVTFLVWHTPLEGFKADMFRVTWKGKPIQYLGAVYKRTPPQPGDYVTLGPGDSTSAAIDLSKAYDLSVSGPYRVSLATVLPDADGAGGPWMLTSNEVAFTVTGGAAIRTVSAPPPPTQYSQAPPAPTFMGCSAAEVQCIKKALGTARAASKNCKNYLNNLPVAMRPTDPQYMKWFGAYGAACYATVLANWCAIENALNNQALTFICHDPNCTAGTYAFVYPCDPYKIYLCDAFFNASISGGFDTKMGTLIHEISHFKAVAGTDDNAYGVAAACMLAANDPTMAKDNADNYEYFAEAKTLAVPAITALGGVVLATAVLVVGAWAIRGRRTRMEHVPA